VVHSLRHRRFGSPNPVERLMEELRNGVVARGVGIIGEPATQFVRDGVEFPNPVECNPFKHAFFLLLPFLFFTFHCRLLNLCR
jgi:hypothetical protein